MGGVSQGRAFLVPYGDNSARFILRMNGTVGLENNGGFIQVRLPLAKNRAPFDASAFSGIELKVRGNGEKYYMHARTIGNTAPWSYYDQQFETSRDWSVVRLPFELFEGQSALRKTLPADKLVSSNSKSSN